MLKTVIIILAQKTGNDNTPPAHFIRNASGVVDGCLVPRNKQTDNNAQSDIKKRQTQRRSSASEIILFLQDF